MSALHIVDTLEALDHALDRAAAMQARSTDAYLESLAGVMFQPRQLLGQVPKDASSADYRSAQLRLYEQLTQRAYDAALEETPFDREHMLRWPFPYVTRSATTVGNSLMMYGQIIKEMNLPAEAHILEMGSGYGPLTYELASMGYRVTCADISAKLLEYVRTRCADLPGRVDTIRCDMNAFSIEGVFDAVIFFESFHHVLNHGELLRRISACLDEKGILVFAGEPIVSSDSPIVPYPWGLRMDGLSLWAIRRQGWLELGFRVDYFKDLLRRSGWTHQRVPSLCSPGADIWICRHARPIGNDRANDSDGIQVWRAIDSAILTQCGWRDLAAGTIRSQAQGGCLCYGPYVSLNPGMYEIEWKGINGGEASAAVAEVTCGKGHVLLRQIAIGTEKDLLARTRFYLKEPVDDIEFRILVAPTDVIELKSIELRLCATADDTNVTES